MKKGTIMILGPDDQGIGRKVFDLKIIQTFPIFNIKSPKTRLISEKRDIKIDNYQHLSIPPDLNIHLTEGSGKKGGHLYFKIDLVDLEKGRLKKDFAHLFTWCSEPILNYQQPHGQWYQAELFCLAKDKDFTKKTGIFIDFFVHNKIQNVNNIINHPCLYKTMRCIYDDRGKLIIIGPHKFNEIVRGDHYIKANFYFTIRFGYYEVEEDWAVLDIPFSLIQE